MPTRDRKKKSYDVNIILYDTIEENEFGVKYYATELYRNTTAMKLSPDSKWQDVQVEVWSLITWVYRSIDSAEKDDYNFNMSMNYTIHDGDKRHGVSKHSDDRAFFGLLGRDDITNLELRINVAYPFKPTREHLKETKARKALVRSSKDSQGSVENLKVEKSESTVSVKELKTLSCIIQ
ncbi:hypothetical protein KCU95_g8338, partial [Aureobasidium melanogenum]